MKEILEEWVETNSENDFQSYKRKGGKLVSEHALVIGSAGCFTGRTNYFI